MKFKRYLVMLSSILLLALASGSVWAEQKCGGSDIANGPFTYTALGLTEATFNGSGGPLVITGFTVTAPSVDPNHGSDLPDVFPGEGNFAPCSGIADASISALEVYRVGDENGDPIEPLKLDPSFGLGLQIRSAFLLSPDSHTFNLPDNDSMTVTVAVGVENPNVGDSDYGDYEVKLAAKAPGYGIGVGNGLHFVLKLRALSATDTTPPVVSVTKPTGDEILGVIPVEVQAYDPDTLPIATGLASLSATVSSAGGAVSNLPIILTLAPPLPVGAGITATGTGAFTPMGGSGISGTDNTANYFTSGSRSGIGSYTINAEATDGAGNIGYGSKSFKLNYSVSFSKQNAQPQCDTNVKPSGANCTAMLEFSVNRSNVTSDGAFMYDRTVVVKLVRTSDNAVMATHSYGTGSILSNVQIGETPVYQTHFKRGDLSGPPTGPGTYRAEVYFLDVDSNQILQAVSNIVTF